MVLFNCIPLAHVHSWKCISFLWELMHFEQVVLEGRADPLKVSTVSKVGVGGTVKLSLHTVLWPTVAFINQLLRIHNPSLCFCQETFSLFHFYTAICWQKKNVFQRKRLCPVRQTYRSTSLQFWGKKRLKEPITTDVCIFWPRGMLILHSKTKVSAAYICAVLRESTVVVGVTVLDPMSMKQISLFFYTK